MKQTLLALLMLTLFSCNYSNMDAKQAKKELLCSTAALSSLNYEVKIKKYLIKNRNGIINFKALDSIKTVSDKECDSIVSEAVNKTYN